MQPLAWGPGYPVPGLQHSGFGVAKYHIDLYSHFLQSSGLCPGRPSDRFDWGHVVTKVFCSFMQFFRKILK